MNTLRSTGQVLWALGQFVMVSVLCGILLAVPLLFPLAGVGRVTNEAINYWESLPSELVAEPLPQRSKILDRDGNVIAEFYSENRVNVTFEEIPSVMLSAIVAIEDDRFYERGAIDLQGTVRAVFKTYVAGTTQGGSTLTQQYVKNVLLNNADTEEEQEAAIEQTPERKIKEMRLAVEVEQNMTKDEIIAAYLNIANFGDGAFGVGAAAMHYFGVPVSELKLEQAALLAGLVQNPTNHNPVKYPDVATARRNVVLQRMYETGHITEEEKDTAQELPLELNVTKQANGCLESSAPFFCQTVRNTLASHPVFGETEAARQKFLYKGGLTIQTTLDPKIQEIADRTAVEALGRTNQYATSLAVVQPGTGQVLAIGTNRAFGDGEGETQVNYATSKFQPGSTFKPITLMAGLENGWTVDKKLNSMPYWCAPAPNKGCFENFMRADFGNIDALQALMYSSNTYFTQLSVDIGTEKVQSMSRRVGMPVPESATGVDTATTLGVYEVSPVNLANAYATIAAHGVYCNPTWITSIKDSTGQDVPIPESNCHQEVNPDVADKVAMTMTNVVDGDDPRRTGRNMSIGRPVMGKTGTTNSSAAVWFAGGTPQYQMAVWVGDPRGGFKYPIRNINLYGETISAAFGSTAAGPMWKAAMTEIHEGVEVEEFTVSSTISSNRQEVVVPDVRGMKVAEAISTLEKSGMTVVISEDLAEANEYFPPNVIAEQSITPGESLPGGKDITLTLSADSEKVRIG